MSRVGKMPLEVPKGVDVTLTAEQISVKGSLGTLARPVHGLVTVKSEDGKLIFTPANESVAADAMSGTMRALVANMVGGVTKGFEKRLALVGVGYRATAQGSKLNLQIGYSHPISKDMPAGVKVECPTLTEIVIKGADAQAVGQVAADVRALRPPEPYKGKGIRYANEKVTIKETKKKLERRDADQERPTGSPLAPDARAHRRATRRAPDRLSHQPAHLRQRHFR